MSTLFVTSVGGHLNDLHQLVPRLQGVDEDHVWVTFDTPQSRSLLADEKVIYVGYTGPRDVRNVLRHSMLAARLFARGHRFSTVVSAGSGIALSFLPLARARGVACHYIECSARSIGPSVTGRLLSALPGIHLYAQYKQWARPPWCYAGSVLDVFAAGAPTGVDTIRRAVVTVGTMENYGFRRLIERALAILPADAEVLWQVGCTDISGLPIAAQRHLPAHELENAIAAADVVIAHAGCGSSVSALSKGKRPVLVPRLSEHGENVDDHQQLIAEELSKRGLAIVAPVERLSLEDLHLAASCSVKIELNPAPFPLVHSAQNSLGRSA